MATKASTRKCGVEFSFPRPGTFDEMKRSAERERERGGGSNVVMFKSTEHTIRLDVTMSGGFDEASPDRVERGLQLLCVGRGRTTTEAS